MTIIKNDYLFSVYLPEVGTPSKINFVDVAAPAGVLATGEGFFDTTTTLTTGDDATPPNLTPINDTAGIGCSVKLKINDGKVDDILEISTPGVAYRLYEILDVVYQNGGASFAQLRVEGVGDGGTVTSLSIFDPGDLYEVYNGTVTTLDLVDEQGNLVPLITTVTSGVLTDAVISPDYGQQIDVLVGTELPVESAGVSVTTATVISVNRNPSQTGGLHKYSGLQFENDIKEIISTVKPDLQIINEDFDENGLRSPQGELTYDPATATLTFHRVEPFNELYADGLYVKRHGDSIDGQYIFNVDNTFDNPIKITLSGSTKTLFFEGDGCVVQPLVNNPTRDGELVNKYYVDQQNINLKEDVEELKNFEETILEILEFDAFATQYKVKVVSSAPATIEDGYAYFETTNVPVEYDYPEGGKYKTIPFENISKVYLSNIDANTSVVDYTLFADNAEVTVNQQKIEPEGGLGRFVTQNRDDSELPKGVFNVYPYRVSYSLVVEKDPTDSGTFEEALVNITLRSDSNFNNTAPSNLATIRRFKLIDPDVPNIHGTHPANGQFSLTTKEFYDYHINNVGDDLDNFIVGRRTLADAVKCHFPEFDLDGKDINLSISRNTKIVFHYKDENGKHNAVTFDLITRSGQYQFDINYLSSLTNLYYFPPDYSQDVFVEFLTTISQRGGQVGALYNNEIPGTAPLSFTDFADHQILDEQQGRLVNKYFNAASEHNAISGIEGVTPKLKLLGEYIFATKNTLSSGDDHIRFGITYEFGDPDDNVSPTRYVMGNVDWIKLKINGVWQDLQEVYDSGYLYLTGPNSNGTSVYKIHKYEGADTEQVYVSIIHDSGGYFEEEGTLKVEYFENFAIDLGEDVDGDLVDPESGPFMVLGYHDLTVPARGEVVFYGDRGFGSTDPEFFTWVMISHYDANGNKHEIDDIAPGGLFSFYRDVDGVAELISTHELDTVTDLGSQEYYKCTIHNSSNVKYSDYVEHEDIYFGVIPASSARYVELERFLLSQQVQNRRIIELRKQLESVVTPYNKNNFNFVTQSPTGDGEAAIQYTRYNGDLVYTDYYGATATSHVYLNEKSSAGNIFNYSNAVKVGDIIQVSNTIGPRNFGNYIITDINQDSQTKIWDFSVDWISGLGEIDSLVTVQFLKISSDGGVAMVEPPADGKTYARKLGVNDTVGDWERSVKLSGDTMTGRLDITPSSGVGLRVVGGFAMKKTNNIGGPNLFYTGVDDVSYEGNITLDNNIVNKKFVDDNFIPMNLNTLPPLTN